MKESNTKYKSELCWICNSSNLSLIKEEGSREPLSAEDFKITDMEYGLTANLYLCNDCSFQQCSDVEEITKFYEDMEDKEYIETSKARSIQAKKILKQINKKVKSGRLLDIGAGSGILVEEAINFGFNSEGLEPSKWLCKIAREKGLNLHNTVLPSKKLKGKFDVITLIDVIEHVTDPVELLKNINNLMVRNGLGVLVTPYVGSFASRLMRFRWWHYRTAHVCYFNLKTIDLALKQSGLKRISITRPSWSFPISYLIKRITQYIPLFKYLPIPKFIKTLTISLNLFDSYLVLFTKEKEDVS